MKLSTLNCARQLAQPMFAVALFAALLFTATAKAQPAPLVTTAWVAGHAADADTRVLDLRRTGFAEGHIPGALWLDPESIRDPQNSPTFILASARFEHTMSRLGISNRTRIIVYDDRGGHLAARLWWMLNAYGHSRTSLVDGGWVQWIAERRKVTVSVPAVESAVFRAKLNRRWLATADDVVAAASKRGKRIVDARTLAEMDGSDKRLSNRGGVIPSAVPIYWEDLLDPVKKTFKPLRELRSIFQRNGIQASDEVIAYCWVGHRSAVDLFALHLLGYKHLKNYLGSWEEWSRRGELPTTPYSVRTGGN